MRVTTFTERKELAGSLAGSLVFILAALWPLLLPGPWKWVEIPWLVLVTGLAVWNVRRWWLGRHPAKQEGKS
jgi:hypothetical protein